MSFLFRSCFFYLSCLLLAKSLQAQVLLRCYVTYAGQTQIITTSMQASPYETRAEDIQGRFRFKPVMVGAAQRIDYIKLYAYFQSRTGDVLIHQASYQPPFLLQPQEFFFTPENRLYAGPLERELEYRCSLQNS